jgi:hypothetical protein
MTKFWERTASSLSNRLFAAGGSALVFWAWALTVWSIRQGGWSYARVTLQPLFEQQAVAPLLALIVAVVVIVSASSLVVERLTLPVLRLLEGYWPRLAQRVRKWLVERWQAKLESLSSSLEDDADSPVRLTSAEVRMWRFPTGEDVMPTRIGNIIRGGERRPWYWYGLDAVIVWPQLWLILPKQARSDLTQSREQLDRAVSAFTWALISCVFAVVWLPALFIGAATAWAIWRWWVPNAAENYAILLTAVFDTHRFSLYDTLHYPRPSGPAEESALGKALTRSLWSDLASAPSTYTAEMPSTGGSRQSIAESAEAVSVPEVV